MKKYLHSQSIKLKIIILIKYDIVKLNLIYTIKFNLTK